MNKDELKIEMLEFRDKYDAEVIFIDDRFFTSEIVSYARELGYKKIMVEVKL